MCWGVGAGERKCKWRCVKLCGGGEERCGEVWWDVGLVKRGVEEDAKEGLGDVEKYGRR